MKARHAAALALVGWYLMVPPPSPKAHDPDDSAPLARWSVRESYDSAAECQRQKLVEQDRLSAMFQLRKDEADRFLFVTMVAARCIATDDPRLKGN